MSLSSMRLEKWDFKPCRVIGVDSLGEEKKD